MNNFTFCHNVLTGRLKQSVCRKGLTTMSIKDIYVPGIIEILTKMFINLLNIISVLCCLVIIVSFVFLKKKESGYCDTVGFVPKL